MKKTFIILTLIIICLSSLVSCKEKNLTITEYTRAKSFIIDIQREDHNELWSGLVIDIAADMTEENLKELTRKFDAYDIIVAFVKNKLIITDNYIESNFNKFDKQKIKILENKIKEKVNSIESDNWLDEITKFIISECKDLFNSTEYFID